MLSIVWRSTARDQLSEIVRDISDENPVAARRAKNVIESAVLPAAEYPYMYRASERVPGLREVVARPTPYIVLYRVASDHIEVVAVVHGKRQWPLHSDSD